MKKKKLFQKLELNKDTVMTLTSKEMSNERAGTNAKTCAGDTCETHKICCPTETCY